MNAMSNMQDQSLQMSQVEGDSQSAAQTATVNEQLVNDSQVKMHAIAEQLRDPISTRYDDIYHPRTDKRVIRK